MKTQSKSWYDVYRELLGANRQNFAAKNPFTKAGKSFLTKVRSGRISLLAVSIGCIFLWFGALKFFPGVSPAEVLAKDTIHHLTWGLVPRDVAIILLALLETGIGLGLILNVRRRLIAKVALIHILCTFTPLFFFPDQIFGAVPFQLTLVGQYIAKNIVIIGALITLLGSCAGSTVRLTRTLQIAA